MSPEDFVKMQILGLCLRVCIFNKLPSADAGGHSTTLTSKGLKYCRYRKNSKFVELLERWHWEPLYYWLLLSTSYRFNTFFIICNILFSDSSTIFLFINVRVLYIKYINYIPLVSLKKKNIELAICLTLICGIQTSYLQPLFTDILLYILCYGYKNIKL